MLRGDVPSGAIRFEGGGGGIASPRAAGCGAGAVAQAEARSRTGTKRRILMLAASAISMLARGAAVRWRLGHWPSFHLVAAACRPEAGVPAAETAALH